MQLKKQDRKYCLLSILLIFFQSIILPLAVQADEISYPQTVTIQYDMNDLYKIVGTRSNIHIFLHYILFYS